MSDSSSDSVEQVVNRFPRLDCEEIDALFEAVSSGKSRISRVQKRKAVREGKTLVEMTFKKEGGGGGGRGRGRGGKKKAKGEKAAGAAASEEEVMTYLQSIVSGEFTLDEFTVRNVLKGESYLRMELTSKADAEQQRQLQLQQQQQKTDKDSTNANATEKKKSKKEIAEMENQLEVLQSRLAMMEKAKSEKVEEMEALTVFENVASTAGLVS